MDAILIKKRNELLENLYGTSIYRFVGAYHYTACYSEYADLILAIKDSKGCLKKCNHNTAAEIEQMVEFFKQVNYFKAIKKNLQEATKGLIDFIEEFVNDLVNTESEEERSFKNEMLWGISFMYETANNSVYIVK